MAYFPEFRPMRSFILQNFRSDNDRPAICVGSISSTCRRASLSSCVLHQVLHITTPCRYPRAPRTSYYNGMMTEPLLALQHFPGQSTACPAPGLCEEFPEDFMERTSQPPARNCGSPLAGSRDRYHPIVFSFAPIFWRTTSRGRAGSPTPGPTTLVFLLKYPDGVSVDEATPGSKKCSRPSRANPR